MDTFDFAEYQDVFAKRLNAILAAQGMTAKDFAVTIGIPDSTIYRYLNSERTPKMANVLKIALFFDVSMDWLFGLTDNSKERWSNSTLRVISRYSIATEDDRRVVDAVLDKYKK